MIYILSKAHLTMRFFFAHFLTFIATFNLNNNLFNGMQTIEFYTAKRGLFKA